MGGWCQKLRETCSRYHARGDQPEERLCSTSEYYVPLPSTRQLHTAGLRHAPTNPQHIQHHHA